jgi:phosphoglycerol transferase MdoB-like AlkP superfamily enzyme
VAAALHISDTTTIIVMVRFIVLFLVPASGSAVATNGCHGMVARPAAIAAERDQTNFAVNQYSPRYVRNRT